MQSVKLLSRLIRVIWMLLTTFFIMKLGSKDYAAAVTQSTFAAFIGMFASMAVLVYFLWKANLTSICINRSNSANINSRAFGGYDSGKPFRLLSRVQPFSFSKLLTR